MESVAFDISYTLVRVGTVGTVRQIHIHIILHPTCTTLTQVIKHVVWYILKHSVCTIVMWQDLMSLSIPLALSDHSTQHVHLQTWCELGMWLCSSASWYCLSFRNLIQPAPLQNCWIESEQLDSVACEEGALVVATSLPMFVLCALGGALLVLCVLLSREHVGELVSAVIS